MGQAGRDLRAALAKAKVKSSEMIAHEPLTMIAIVNIRLTYSIGCTKICLRAISRESSRNRMLSGGSVARALSRLVTVSVLFEDTVPTRASQLPSLGGWANPSVLAVA